MVVCCAALNLSSRASLAARAFLASSLAFDSLSFAAFASANVFELMAFSTSNVDSFFVFISPDLSLCRILSLIEVKGRAFVDAVDSVVDGSSNVSAELDELAVVVVVVVLFVENG